MCLWYERLRIMIYISDICGLINHVRLGEWKVSYNGHNCSHDGETTKEMLDISEHMEFTHNKIPFSLCSKTFTATFAGSNTTRWSQQWITIEITNIINNEKRNKFWKPTVLRSQ